MEDNEIDSFYLDTLSKKLTELPPERAKKYVEDLQLMRDFWNNEITSKDDVRKNCSKIKNNSIDNYERFKSWMFLEFLSMKIGNKTGFFARDDGLDKRAWEQYKLGEWDKEELFQALAVRQLGMMTNFFNVDGKIFRINNDKLDILRNTKVDIKYQKPFFPNMFLSTPGLIIDNVEIFGMIIRLRYVTGQNMKNDISTGHDSLEIITIGIDLEDGENIWFWENIFESDKDKEISNKAGHLDDYKPWVAGEKEKNIRKNIRRITINFLNFINHPEVELITRSMKILRDARVKKGRLGIPDSVEINLTGRLKRYINETMQQNEKAWELGHRFWVRGHWKHFQSSRYKRKKGQKTWVLPYIKGRGELTKKNYYVGEKEQCWEHEKQMIKIIRGLYPEHEVKTHDRKTLDGLEIDCYIPELRLGFEYNGKQHYEHVKIFHKTTEDFEAQKNRDVEKMRRAKDKGIKIITIRYDEPLNEAFIQKRIKHSPQETEV